jgi:hypothetical protein
VSEKPTKVKRPLSKRTPRHIARCITIGCQRRPQLHRLLCEQCEEQARRDATPWLDDAYYEWDDHDPA